MHKKPEKAHDKSLQLITNYACCDKNISEM